MNLLQKNEVKIVGANPYLFTKSSWEFYKSNLAADGIELLEVFEDLVDQIWVDQPKGNQDPILIHPIKYSGKSHWEKFEQVVSDLEKNQIDGMVITSWV